MGKPRRGECWNSCCLRNAHAVNAFYARTEGNVPFGTGPHQDGGGNSASVNVCVQSDRGCKNSIPVGDASYPAGDYVAIVKPTLAPSALTATATLNQHELFYDGATRKPSEYNIQVSSLVFFFWHLAVCLTNSFVPPRRPSLRTLRTLGSHATGAAWALA